MVRMYWLDSYKDIIICLYLNEGLKQTEIAKEFGVSQLAISIRLREWGVSNPDGNRFKRNKINKEVLYDLYWNKEMHPSKIAKIFGCHKQTIINFMIKYNITRRTKSQARIGKLNPIYKVGHTQETRNKMSAAFVEGRKIGFNTNWGVGNYYDTFNQGKVWMRSGWEIKVADYLTSKSINWYYEFKWLDLGNMKYLPDFYLPDINLFIEVKGRMKGKDLEKVLMARKLGNKILLWGGEELLRRGIINNSGSTIINRKYRN